MSRARVVLHLSRGSRVGELLRRAHKQQQALQRLQQHIATDLDTALILACALTLANRREEEAAPPLKADLDSQHAKLGQLYIDRGYINRSLVDFAVAAAM